MAPPTLPTEAKKRRGTYRKDRDPGGGTSALVPVQRAPLDVPVPETLEEHGIREWHNSLKVCPWIALSDLTALRLLCEAIDRREKLSAALAGSDLMLETSTGYAYTNPILATLEKTEERITKWMLQLGMTPSARGALGVAEVKQTSKLDELAERRRQRQAGLPDSTPQSPRTPSTGETEQTSSSSSTPTVASRRTASQARRALRSTPAGGSETSSARPSPETQ